MAHAEERPMYKGYLSVIALLLIALTSACSAGGDAGAQLQSGESQSALGTTESCQTLAADKVLTGGGSFTTDRAYNHSTCASGFLLDLNNLGAVYRGGTLAAYADRAPTDQATCEKLQMRVYAWKRESNGTLTFLGGAFPNGRWLTNAFGKQYCQTPSVMLEQRFPGYVTGGNYRLAMRAHSLDAQGAVVRQRIFFRTLKKRTPVLPGHVADDAVLSLNRLPTSGIPLNLNSVWARKSGWTGSSPLCRDLGLKLAFEKVTVPAYVKLGATEQVVRDRLTKEESIYNLLCNTPLASSAQQANLRRNRERQRSNSRQGGADARRALGGVARQGALHMRHAVQRGGSVPEQRRAALRHGRAQRAVPQLHSNDIGDGKPAEHYVRAGRYADQRAQLHRRSDDYRQRHLQ
jgi:hypothetical protein